MNRSKDSTATPARTISSFFPSKLACYNAHLAFCPKSFPALPDPAPVVAEAGAVAEPLPAEGCTSVPAAGASWWRGGGGGAPPMEAVPVEVPAEEERGFVTPCIVCCCVRVEDTRLWEEREKGKAEARKVTSPRSRQGCGAEKLVGVGR